MTENKPQPTQNNASEIEEEAITVAGLIKKLQTMPQDYSVHINALGKAVLGITDVIDLEKESALQKGYYSQVFLKHFDHDPDIINDLKQNNADKILDKYELGNLIKDWQKKKYSTFDIAEEIIDYLNNRLERNNDTMEFQSTENPASNEQKDASNLRVQNNADLEKLKNYHKEVKTLIDETCKGIPDIEHKRLFSTTEILCFELHRKLGEALKLQNNADSELIQKIKNWCVENQVSVILHSDNMTIESLKWHFSAIPSTKLYGFIEALSTPISSEWQPIETAPDNDTWLQEGKRFLCWNGQVHKAYKEKGVVMCDKFNQKIMPPPTKWQPLPTPPISSEKGE